MSDSTLDRPLEALMRQPRLSDRVASDIIELIVSKRLQPGDALPPERELGEQFGVSRTVIREAVRELDAKGLVQVRVGSRIRVAAVDPETVQLTLAHFIRSHGVDARVVVELSDALVVAAAGLAARHAGPDDLRALAAAADAAGTTAEGEPAFREALVLSAHNELLAVLHSGLAHTAGPPTPGAPEQAARSRSAVLDAVTRRHAQAAEQAMRGHLELWG